VALISAFFAEIKALSGRGDFSLSSSNQQGVWTHYDGKAFWYSSRNLWKWWTSVADASLSVQKHLLHQVRRSLHTWL
jgi:hypothetical protein